MHSARAQTRSNQPATPRRFPKERRRSDDRDDPASVGRAIHALTDAMLALDLNRNERRACLYLLGHLAGWGRTYDTVPLGDLATALDRSPKTAQRTVRSLVERGLIDYQSAVGQGEHGWIRLLTTGLSSDTTYAPPGQNSDPATDAPGQLRDAALLVAGQPAAETCPPIEQATSPANALMGGQPPATWRPGIHTASTWMDSRDPVGVHPPIDPLAHEDPRSPLQRQTANEAGQEDNRPDRVQREPASSDPEREYLDQLIQPLGNHMGESMEFDQFVTEKLGEIAAILRAAGYTPQEAFQYAAARGDLRKGKKPLYLLAYRLRHVIDDPHSRSRYEAAAAAAEAAQRRVEREAEQQAVEDAKQAEAERLATAEFAAWRTDHPEFAAVEALPIHEQLALIGTFADFLNRENGFPHEVTFAERALANHQARERAATTTHPPQRR